MDHELKSLPLYFKAVLDGRKPFETHKNDRSFKEGDVALLQEHDAASQQYTGRERRRVISYIRHEYDNVIMLGYCILRLH